MKTRTLVLVSCALEGATGLALIASPGLVVRLLLGAGLCVGGIAVGRVGGFGLLSLALACWPNRNVVITQATVSLFVYNLLAATYLCYLGLKGSIGYLLWPACALHALLALLFAVLACLSVRSVSVECLPPDRTSETTRDL
jgi:hypothetical protein